MNVIKQAQGDEATFRMSKRKTVGTPYSSVSCGPLLVSDSHIPAHVNTECLDDRYPKLKIYVSELVLDSYEYMPSTKVTINYTIWP
jgi:hypothetical protein